MNLADPLPNETVVMKPKPWEVAGLREDEYNKIIEEERRNPLEGSILVHGFESNIKEADRRTEDNVIEELLKTGAIVSPSKRGLNANEITRFQYDAPFDLNRVCFEARTGDENDGIANAYIGSFFFVAPPKVLANNVLSEDFAYGKRSISANNKNGVEIPLEKGLLFVKTRLFHTTREYFRQRAVTLGLTEAEYLNRYIRLIPDTFNPYDRSEMWKLINANINPSTNVQFRPETIKKLQQYTSVKHLLSYLNNRQVVREEELGTGTVKENGSLITDALKQSMESSRIQIGQQIEQTINQLLQDKNAMVDIPIQLIQRLEVIIELAQLDPNSQLRPYESIQQIVKKAYEYDQKRLAQLLQNQTINRREPYIAQKPDGSYYINKPFSV